MKFKIAIVFIVVTSQLFALNIKNQTPGCFTQSSLSEFFNAIQNSDKAGMMRLVLNQECFFIQTGTPYGLINKQSSMSLIRVYWDANGYKLWVPTKAIQ